MVAIRMRLRSPSSSAPYTDGGGDDRLDAVVEEQVGKEEGQRHRVVAQVAQGVGELAEALPDGATLLGHDVQGRVVASRRNGMSVKPAHQTAAESMRHRAAVASARPKGGQREEGEVERQQEAAAEVAEGPAARGDAVALVLVEINGRIESLMTPAAARQRLPPTMANAAELPVVAGGEEDQHANTAPVHAKAASSPFLFAVRSAIAPSGGSRIGAEDRREGDQLEEQRPRCATEHPERCRAGRRRPRRSRRSR